MTNDDIIYNVGINNGLTPNAATNLVAQGRLESGNYSSNLFNTDNNAFGYKYVGQSGASQGILTPQSEWNDSNVPEYYAHYNTLNDSALEIIHWINRRIADGTFQMSDLETPQSYAQAFKNGDYYGESAVQYSQDLISEIKNNLLNGLKSAGQTIQNNPLTSIGVGILIILLILSTKKSK